MFSYEHFHCSSLKGRSSFRLGNIKPAEFYQLLARHYWLTCTGNTLCRNFIYIEDVEDCVHDTWLSKTVSLSSASGVHRWLCRLSWITNQPCFLSGKQRTEYSKLLKKKFPFIPNLPRENSYCFLMSFPTMKFLKLPRELLERKFRITCLGFPFDFFVWIWNEVGTMSSLRLCIATFLSCV